MKMKKENWFKKHPIWTGIIIFFVFVFLVGTLTEESEHKQLESSGQAIKEFSEQETEEPITRENNTFSAPIEDETPNIEKQEDYFLVTRVIDGDTIEIEGGERIRLICINTPETGEEGYKEAKDFLRDLILYEEVELVKDVTERDKYNRLLRYIYLQDGTFVNEQLVRLGLGVAYPYGQDTRFCPIIEAAERMAEEDSLGIWEIEEEEPEEPDTDYVCSTNVYNCDDFNSHSEAQYVFEYCGGLSNDIHRLDGDNDGIACEGLSG